MPQRRSGFTLIELMITLVIVVILSSLGFISLTGYLPKQRLLATARFIEGGLQRAQSEAYSRSALVGVHFKVSGATTVGEVFIDADGNYQQDLTEGMITNVLFRDSVSFTTAPCAGVNMGPIGCATVPDCYVFFDNSGQAVNPLPTGAIPGVNQGDPIDYELFIRSDKLEPDPTTATNTREIEVLSSGLVEVIRQGQVGNANGGRSAVACVQ